MRQSLFIPSRSLLFGGLALLAAGVGARASGVVPAVRLGGHVPAAVASAVPVARVGAAETIHLAISLPLQNRAALNDLLTRLYDPADPLYGHYLKPAEFTQRFGPTAAQYAAVARYAQSQGLSVTGTHSNRLILDIAGPSAAVERAFATRLLRFTRPDGSTFRAPDREPAVPGQLAGSVAGIVGLDDQIRMHPHLRMPSTAAAEPSETGTGHNGGLTPSDIKTAYNLAGTSLTGAGQTLALFELDGYVASDITTYEDSFTLPHVPLTNVLVDTADGSAGDGRDEVTLDIELQVALASGVSGIRVYEAPNTDQGVLHGYNQIATDDSASVVSTSWGLDEVNTGSSFAQQESQIFTEMATQGQSIFAASGDSGAYDDQDNANLLAVDDPASQPMVTGVGGTALTTNGPGGAWMSETTWNTRRNPPDGGGGGISTLWTIPSYQNGVVSNLTQGSTTQRNVPDVALSSDPNRSGYAILVAGNWVVYGGTSCAAPLWSAFAALVNQNRASLSLPPIGFANPAIYQIGKGAQAATDFHDIADSSTNLFYPAVSGYDDATGWGTFNGAQLLTDLTGAPPPAVNLDQSVYTVTEGLSVPVSAFRATAPVAASVRLTSTDGTAHAGTDYTAISQTLNLSVGTTTANASVQTTGGRLFAGPITFSLALDQPSAAQLGTPHTATVNINFDPVGTAPTAALAFVTGPSAVTVQWQRHSTNEDGFTVERSENSGAYHSIGTAASGSSSFVDSSATAGATVYSYRITAVRTSPSVATSSTTTPGVTVPTGGVAKVTPAKLAFSGKHGHTIAAKKVTLQNTGKGTLAGVVSLSSGTAFQITSGAGAFQLAPKAKKTILVALVASSAGSYTGSVTIASNNAAGPKTVTLTGKLK